MGAGHCLGMCGGIVAAMSLAIRQSPIKRRLALLLVYNFGRISSYGLIGALVGLLIEYIAGNHLTWLRVFAGLVLILMGFYVAGLWKALALLERGGYLLWRYLKPLSNRLTPVTSYRTALLLGLLWGWLPCGLIYTALAYSALQGVWYQSAVVMMAFGLGTLPSMMVTGVAAAEFVSSVQKVLQKQIIRVCLAFAYIAFGIWTIWQAQMKLI